MTIADTVSYIVGATLAVAQPQRGQIRPEEGFKGLRIEEAEI
jgi:hypothetical protein